MRKITFIKMHGAGNDFVFVDATRRPGAVGAREARLLLDRHFGIGGDQLLVLRSAKAGKPCGLAIYNPDGSQAEMCGNGVRAVGHYLTRFKGVKRDFQIDTEKGRRIGIQVKPGGRIDVDMGEPIFEGREIPVAVAGEIVGRPLEAGGRTFAIHALSMGNPHCVIFVDDVDAVPLEEIGPPIENHSFFPRRVNVEFVQVLSRQRLKARVWERGAGVTLACGTGACAAAVAAARAGLADRALTIDLPGGRLSTRWGSDNHVHLSGPAVVTFEGTFYLDGRK